MAYDPNNVFAKIIRGEIPCAKIYEDDDTLSFMDAMPQTDGHALIVPKRAQAEDLLDMPPDALHAVIVTTQKIAQAVDRAFRPDGIRIMQFNRPAAGQSVFHIHFHVIPMYEGVPMKLHAREMADKQVLAAQAEKIKAEL